MQEWNLLFQISDNVLVQNITHINMFIECEALLGKGFEWACFVLFCKTEAAVGGGHIWLYILCEVKTVFAGHAYRKKENREVLVVCELVC